jgi:hypothetical protein
MTRAATSADKKNRKCDREREKPIGRAVKRRIADVPHHTVAVRNVDGIAQQHGSIFKRRLGAVDVGREIGGRRWRRALLRSPHQ